MIITASTLVNGTFAEVMGYASKARLVGLYGPSASLLPDVFFEQGVGAVFSFRVTDPKAFVHDTMNDIDMEAAIKERQMPYLLQPNR